MAKYQVVYSIPAISLQCAYHVLPRCCAQRRKTDSVGSNWEQHYLKHRHSCSVELLKLLFFFLYHTFAPELQPNTVILASEQPIQATYMTVHASRSTPRCYVAYLLSQLYFQLWAETGSWTRSSCLYALKVSTTRYELPGWTPC